MKMLRLLVIIFLSLPVFSFAVNSQYTASRKVERSFTITPDLTIKISAKKSDVRITAWNRREVLVQLSVETFNTQKSIAEKELDYVSYTLVQDKKYLILNNNFLQPGKGKKLSSDFKVIWQIFAPGDVAIILTSSYGIVEMKGFTRFVNCYSEFGKVHISDAQGKQNFYTYQSVFKSSKSKVSSG